jgi:hypothetical protein
MSVFAFISTFLDDANLLQQVCDKVKPLATNIKDPLNRGTSQHPLTLGQTLPLQPIWRQTPTSWRVYPSSSTESSTLLP